MLKRRFVQAKERLWIFRGFKELLGAVSAIFLAVFMSDPHLQLLSIGWSDSLNCENVSVNPDGSMKKGRGSFT